jgi:hypothetical protein
MNIQRRTLLAGGGAALAVAAAPGAKAEEAANNLAAFIAPDGASIKAVKVTLADGQTSIAEADIVADKSPYPLFKQFLTHDASATAIYAAPPHHKIQGAKAAAKSLLFVVAGETTLTAGKTAHKCPAGTVILQDVGTELREQAGPEGYTAIKVQLAD